MEVYQNGIAKLINHPEKLQIVKSSKTDQICNQAGVSLLLERKIGKTLDSCSHLLGQKLKTGTAIEYRDWRMQSAGIIYGTSLVHTALNSLELWFSQSPFPRPHVFY